jgi:hypothetical protein
MPISLSDRIAFWVMLANPLSKYYFHPCPDGIQRHVYKNIKDSVPIPEDLYSAGDFSIGVKNLREFSIGLSVEWEKAVHPLIDTLDSKTVESYKMIHSAYSSYKNNPCLNDKYYQETIDDERKKYHEMSEFKDTLNAFISYAKINPNNIETSKLFSDICKYKICKNNPACTRKAFLDAQERAETWTGEGGNDAS